MHETDGWYAGSDPVMLLLVLVGVVGACILLERLFVIVIRSKNNGRVFIERIIQLVRAAKIDEAIKVCVASTAALSDLGLLILRSRSRDEIELQHVASAAALAIVPRLTRRLQYLSTLAIVAILLGMLGTVLGARSALLGAAASVRLAGGPATVSRGVEAPAGLWLGLADALRPGALSLVVAMVLLLGRGYLLSQADAITEEIQEFSARLINALIDRPDVRLGHR